MELEDFVREQFQEMKQEMKDFREDVKQDFRDVNGKLDTTCDRLTTQETKYADHIENEQKERQSEDTKIDKKYKFWTLILGVATTILGVLEVKKYM